MYQRKISDLIWLKYRFSNFFLSNWSPFNIWWSQTKQSVIVFRGGGSTAYSRNWTLFSVPDASRESWDTGLESWAENRHCDLFKVMFRKLNFILKLLISLTKRKRLEAGRSFWRALQWHFKSSGLDHQPGSKGEGEMWMDLIERI